MMDSSNVYVTQVVPNPWDASVPIVKEYQNKLGGNYGFVSLEGYINAKVLHTAIQQVKGEVNSDSLKQALESLNTDVGGLNVSFSPSKHRGLDKTYLTKIVGADKFEYVNKID